MTPLPVAPRERVPLWVLYGVLTALAVLDVTYEVRHSYDLYDQGYFASPGFDTAGRTNVVSVVAKGSPLQKGDVLERVNGLPWRGWAQVDHARSLAKPGDLLFLAVRRDGQSLSVPVPWRITPRTLGNTWLAAVLEVFTNGVVPWFSAVFGFGVAFLRPRDPVAWIFLGIMLSSSRFFTWVVAAETPFRQIDRFSNVLLNNLYGPMFVLLGLYFGVRWRQRWLVILGWGLVAFLGSIAVLQAVDQVWEREHAQASQGLRALLSHFGWTRSLSYVTFGIFFYCAYGKYFTTDSPDLKRRLRILLWCLNILLTPALLYTVAAQTGVPIPWGFKLTVFLLISLVPFAFAYVILVHRAVDLGVVLRSGLQYTMARGGVFFLQLIVAVLGIVWAVRFMEEQHHVGPAVHGAILAAYAALLFAIRWISGPLFRWIDRHFFREAYSSEQLMADLTEKIRTVLEPQELFETVSHRLSQALHVQDVAFFLRNGSGFQPAYATVPTAGGPAVDYFPADCHAVKKLAEDHEPMQLFLDDARCWCYDPSVPAADRERLISLNTQVLLPLTANNGLLGFASLGPKRSEAPYTRNDLRLLKAVATQAGLALENSRLATSLAQEAAQKERAHREIEIASEVQQRLFPQKPLDTSDVEIAGTCRPALAVGGDYFDFFKLENGAYGFAVGDVAGKGLGAALVMATVQASLRTQVLDGDPDLADLITKLNQVVYDSSTRNRFATLFYGQYDPATRQLTWVNAGHNPPFLLRAEGTVERLALTGIAVGLRRKQAYRQSSVTLNPGDTVVAFTDGISEAMNPAREEFGEDRLQSQLAPLPPASLLTRILAAADDFAAGALQHDDMTMVVLRAR